MSGDGTSCGLRRRPKNRNPAMTANTPSGIRKRAMAIDAASSSLHDGGLAAPGPDPIAPIGDGQHAAERHDEETAPNPGDERLHIDADAPCPAADWLAERDIEIAGHAGIDRHFGHCALLRVIDALFRIERLHAATFARHLHPTLHTAQVRSGDLA